MLPTKSQDKINADLKKKESVINTQLLPVLVDFLTRSSSAMSAVWSSLEEKDKTYRAVRMPDDADKEAVKKDKPIKIVVPVALAQVQTAAAFLYDQYVNKDFLYEFAGVGSEDVTGDLLLQKDLKYQVSKAKILPTYYNGILDGLKYGFGVGKVDWRVKKEKRRVMIDDTGALAGIQEGLGGLFSMFGVEQPAALKPQKIEKVEEFTTFEGSHVTNVSPYCFFPDPSVPLARFQEGDFVAHEEEVTIGSLKREEGKLYHGTEHIETGDALSNEWLTSRHRRAGRSFVTNERGTGKGSVTGMAVFTEVQFILNPKEWKDKLDIDFGTTEVEKWVAVVANDRRIISLEPLSYLHGRFTYVIWESSPDHSFFFNGGFLDSINELQKQVTWLINTHMASVSQAIRNRFMVNPSNVHVEDIENDRTAIRTKLGFTGEFERAIKQVQVQDVTAGHWNDVMQVQRIMQTVSGVSENAMGTYSTGRRSATQTRDVNSGASLRLNTIGSFHYNGWHIGLGEQILANTRQNRSEEMYANIVGDESKTIPFDQVYMSSPAKIVADLDFTPYSVTSPNERNNRIKTLTELATLLMTNPEATMMLRKDPAKVITYLAKLQGIENMDAFNLDEQRPVEATVGDQAQIQDALAKGGMPMDVFNPFLK
jgi:hypothetical protein